MDRRRGGEFLIIGNENAIGYKTVFPLIKDNKIWLGCTKPSEFDTPDGSVKKLGNVAWFTNIQHAKRHQSLMLDTMANNLRFNHKLVSALVRNCGVDANDPHYPKYDNYDAIEVPFIKAIPSDYEGVMGVPLSFLYSYDPDQFEITSFRKGDDGKDLSLLVGGGDEVPVHQDSSSAAIGLLNSPEATKVNGRSRYLRIGIQRRKKEED